MIHFTNTLKFQNSTNKLRFFYIRSHKYKSNDYKRYTILYFRHKMQIFHLYGQTENTDDWKDILVFPFHSYATISRSVPNARQSCV